MHVKQVSDILTMMINAAIAAGFFRGLLRPRDTRTAATDGVSKQLMTEQMEKSIRTAVIILLV